jgi:hypothetical protein
MSDLKFFAVNLVDQASMTGTNTNSQFPLSNLQDSRRTKVYRSTTNSDSVVFDFQESSLIDSVIIVDNPRDGFSLSTITLELNGTNSWGAPAFTQSLTFSTDFGVGVNLFTEQSYRYARIVMTSVAGYCELPKIFIGKSIDLGRCQNVGWTFKNDSISKITKNRYEQKFIDVIGTKKEANLSLSLLDKDQLDQVFEVYDQCSVTKPLFVQYTNNQMVNDSNRYSGMYYLKSEPQITNTIFGRFALSLNIEEAK